MKVYICPLGSSAEVEEGGKGRAAVGWLILTRVFEVLENVTMGYDDEEEGMAHSVFITKKTR